MNNSGDIQLNNVALKMPMTMTDEYIENYDSFKNERKKLIHRVQISISNEPHPITTANKRYALTKKCSEFHSHS